MSTSTLGVIGAGTIGAGVARLAAEAGFDVILSNSRGPETLAALVAELGPRARAATPAETARAADLVLASLPLKAHERLPVAELAGKTVIDPMNYTPTAEWSIPDLDADELTSSELIQRHLPAARVIKALHNIGPAQLTNLSRPPGASDRTALPISGDDPAAKQEVADLLDALGFDTVDLGILAESWRSEPNTPLFAQVYRGQPPPGLAGHELVAWVQAAPGIPAPASRVKELAAATARGPAGLRI